MPIMNATPTPNASPKTSDVAASRKALEARLPDALKDPVNRVVTAGMKILYSPESRATIMQIYQQIVQGGFQPQQIANGMTHLMSMIVAGSRGKAPMPALYPAAVILLTYVLEDLQKKGLQVTDDLVKTVGSMMAQKLKQTFGGGGSPTPPAPGATPPAPVASPAAPAPSLLNGGA